MRILLILLIFLMTSCSNLTLELDYSATCEKGVGFIEDSRRIENLDKTTKYQRITYYCSEGVAK